MQVLTIGELAQRAKVNVETVRYYERRGLLPSPRRRASGYRQYAAVDVARVQAICRAKRLGFTLREIGELLPILSESRPRCPSLVRHAAGKIAEITRKIGELEEARSALERLVAGCTWETGSKSGCQSISTLKLKED